MMFVSCFDINNFVIANSFDFFMGRKINWDGSFGSFPVTHLLQRFFFPAKRLESGLLTLVICFLKCRIFLIGQPRWKPKECVCPQPRPCPSIQDSYPESQLPQTKSCKCNNLIAQHNRKRKSTTKTNCNKRSLCEIDARILSYYTILNLNCLCFV